MAGSNERDVAPLDAPIAAAYPTAANRSTAQWRVYTDIGRDLSSRGRHDEAGAYLRRALAEAKAGFGDRDPHVAAARNNLAELYRLQKRWDEAEALYADAAAALERHFGPGHPAAATATHNLAGCQLARGNHGGAYRTYAAAAEKKARSLGKAHPDYATTLFHMAEAKRAGGDGASAAVLLEESVRVLDAIGQGDTAAACRRLERLAQVQGDMLRDHAAAELTRRKVLEAREQHAAAAAGGGRGGRGPSDGSSSPDGGGIFGRVIGGVIGALGGSEAGGTGQRARKDDEGGGEGGESARGSRKPGFVAAAALALHGAAVAAASEAHAGSLAELGRWDEALDAALRGVRIHEERAGWHPRPRGDVVGYVAGALEDTWVGCWINGWVLVL